MAPWLLLGFLFAGLLHIYMPKGSVRKYMGKNNFKSVLYASLLGIPLPLCSCGVIPTGISFHKEGASKGATVSFLISTPQTGVDSIMATYSLLGLPFALLRPVVAFFSGIFGGLLTNSLTTNSTIEMHRSEKEENGISGNKMIAMLQYAFHIFLMDIAKWLLIGLALAALISLVLPDDFFTLYLDNEFVSMLIVLAASVPVYVCATGSIPIAAVLMMKGLSPGAALVFLMAGPATNAATMAVIGKSIDKKTLLVYLVSIIGSAMVFGLLTNHFLPHEWFTAYISHLGHDHNEILPYWLKISSGILLALLILYGYLKKYIFKNNSSIDSSTINMDNIVKIKVNRMTCSHCKQSVENKLSDLPEIASVNANPDKNEVLINGTNPDLNKIKTIISDLGFDYKGEIK
jgi:uncharacterized membrane protein YraQ (UPF0718 family)/copper chaperone CopZ